MTIKSHDPMNSLDWIWLEFWLHSKSFFLHRNMIVSTWLYLNKQVSTFAFSTILTSTVIRSKWRDYFLSMSNDWSKNNNLQCPFHFIPIILITRLISIMETCLSIDKYTFFLAFNFKIQIFFNSSHTVI